MKWHAVSSRISQTNTAQPARTRCSSSGARIASAGAYICVNAVDVDKWQQCLLLSALSHPLGLMQGPESLSLSPGLTIRKSHHTEKQRASPLCLEGDNGTISFISPSRALIPSTFRNFTCCANTRYHLYTHRSLVPRRQQRRPCAKWHRHRLYQSHRPQTPRPINDERQRKTHRSARRFRSRIPASHLPQPPRNPTIVIGPQDLSVLRRRALRKLHRGGRAIAAG